MGVISMRTIVTTALMRKFIRLAETAVKELLQSGNALLAGTRFALVVAATFFGPIGECTSIVVQKSAMIN
jgi:hypothetical protein